MSTFYTGNISTQSVHPNQRQHIQNGIIEEISHDRRNTFVTISYGILGDFNIIHVELITLIITPNTVIRNQFGRRGSVRNLRVGMRVDATFSSRMTMSIPPQATAYVITYTEPNSSFHVTTAQVLFPDPRNHSLMTGQRNDSLSLRIFIITPSTVILDRRGRRISLRNLRSGNQVRIEHASFQTASIPPQTTAFHIQVL